jgi:hypothetical protein
MVERDAKPAIDVRVNRVIIVAKLPGRFALFLGLRLRGRAVFVGSAHVEGFVAGKPAIARIYVRGKDLNEVSEVRYIVNVRKRRSYQFSFHDVMII